MSHFHNIPAELFDKIIVLSDNYFQINCYYFNLWKSKRVESANKIRIWYCGHKLEYIENIKTKKDLIRYYNLYYPDEYFMKYPLFMKKKLFRKNLPNFNSNRRSDVLAYMKQPKISMSDILYCGW